MLKQLARFRVHLMFGAGLVFWLSLGTFAGVIDGDNVFHALWATIKEIKPMEWVSIICLWFAFATLIKENEQLRAKLNIEAGRQSS